MFENLIYLELRAYCVFILHVFFQTYENGVVILPESVKENTERIPELLTECRASSTTKGYYRSYMKWVKWLEKNGIYDTMSTMKPLVICVLASLIQEVVSVSVLSSAVYGICWAYSVIGISSPTDSELVKIVYEAGKRHLSVPITKNNL